MENYIKNIDYKKVISLKDLVQIKDISMLSLVDRKSLSMTIISADKGKEIPTHTSIGDVLVTVIDGKAEIMIDGNSFETSSSESILIPANAPHSLKAIEAFKILVIQVKSE
ncbi:cupin domain-containing protein [Brachyspira hyodysenteriae]|uniref:cupin domain-containing protein n=1 Tax=Brachyspira hyodysenteriae TaxID=159 RepID=UPI0022CD829A|nr:cupin domain-containing protein [Brachyspira hyodysenteriae]MCZ9838796.1 cupin domain-containing protein [Brachyspira hyodysenteriae]MCZ9848085.1 cupin domain-containing protein [Brachyspira hyodysenteriae]MCZ9851868.1 cupin domain-containing protein [Brachyspira hyodysenteriae]MCZ9859394.1 cupin domain-containing protein [Brachyspira hyodysenteriae]MCZ9870618.1 cupin domain-containing protein [Brachyspira hyodysenteriae]